MSFWSNLFGGAATNPYSSDQIYGFVANTLAQLRQSNPEEYWLKYGTASPEAAARTGENPRAFERNPDGTTKLDEAGNPVRRTSGLTEEERKQYQTDIEAINAQNAPPPPDQPSAPPPPPEEGGEVPPGYSGATARQKLEALLPPGFDVTAFPETFGEGAIGTRQTEARRSAQEFINNMLRRGTITPTGAEAAGASLGTQDPYVRERLGNLSSTILANERAKLRGIAGEGYTAAAAPGETGEFFNAEPFKQRVQSEISAFDFPGAFASQAGDIGYDTSTLGAAGGAVGPPSDVPSDLYAPGAGEGTEDEEFKRKYRQEKRTTSVF